MPRHLIRSNDSRKVPMPAASNGIGLDLPEVSLVKKRSGPKEGSKEWLQAVADEHGDTDEGKLQFRRDRVTAYLTIVDSGIKKMQAQKKAYLSENDKLQAALSAEMAILSKSGQSATDGFELLKTRLQATQMERFHQSNHFENMITSTTSQLVMAESNCLVFDALTLREEVDVDGEKGYVRYSAALIMDSICTDIYRMLKRTRKVYSLLERQFPEAALAASKTVTSGDLDVEDDDGEEFQTDRAGVVTASERKQIKRKIQEENA